MVLFLNKGLSKWGTKGTSFSQTIFHSTTQPLMGKGKSQSSRAMVEKALQYRVALVLSFNKKVSWDFYRNWSRNFIYLK